MGFHKKECIVGKKKKGKEGLGFDLWVMLMPKFSPTLPINQIMPHSYSTFQWIPSKLRMNRNSSPGKGHVHLNSLVSPFLPGLISILRVHHLLPFLLWMLIPLWPVSVIQVAAKTLWAQRRLHRSSQQSRHSPHSHHHSILIILFYLFSLPYFISFIALNSLGNYFNFHSVSTTRI